MFLSYNKVRMNDTDMAGVIFFANQFRFCHDAFEDFVESKGHSIHYVFNQSPFIFAIVHCEAEFLAPLAIGDKLAVHLNVYRIGDSSFTIAYDIYRNESELVGRAKTTHVCLDRNNRKKTPLPESLRELLQQHLLEAKG